MNNQKQIPDNWSGGSMLWLDEARTHLKLVIDTSLSSDDQINLQHVREAHALVCRVLNYRGNKRSPQPIVEALDAAMTDERVIP